MLDKLAMFIAFRLLPRSIVMWAAIKVVAHATTGHYSDQEVTALTAIDAIKRWN